MLLSAFLVLVGDWVWGGFYRQTAPGKERQKSMCATGELNSLSSHKLDLTSFSWN